MAFKKVKKPKKVVIRLSDKAFRIPHRQGFKYVIMWREKVSWSLNEIESQEENIIYFENQQDGFDWMDDYRRTTPDLTIVSVIYLYLDMDKKAWRLLRETKPPPH